MDDNPLRRQHLHPLVTGRIEGAVCIDAGANKGDMTDWMILSGASRVIAFEPVPWVYQEMLRRLDAFVPERVVPVCAALGAGPGRLTGQRIYNTWSLASEDEAASRGLAPAVEWTDRPPFDVAVRALDQFLGVLFTSPDFIKLDVDGHELEVLQGAFHTLQVCKAPILFEYSCLPAMIRGHKNEDLVSFIYAAGYRAWSLDLSHKAEFEENMLSCYPDNSSFDVVLIHKDDPLSNGPR